MPVVTFHHEHRSFDVEPNTNLRELMLKVNVQPYKGLDFLLNCRGNNFCGTCAVEVVDNKGASPQGKDEQGTLIGNLAIAHVLEKNVRLSCQTAITGDMVVKTHPLRMIDRKATKERFALLGMTSFFVLAFLGIFVFMFLDMIKIF